MFDIRSESSDGETPQTIRPTEKKSALISVIVPVYRVEPYIETCIRSLLAQSYRNLEVILVDDGGGDQSINKAEAILRTGTLPWKTVVHTVNRGLSAARNTGVTAAQGDYIFFLDSDDYLANDCLETLVELALRDHADMTTANIMKVSEDGFQEPFTSQATYQQYKGNIVEALYNSEFAITAWNKLIKRSFYESSGVSFVEGIIYEDEIWSLELALASPRVSFAPNFTYYYLQRKGGITGSASGSIKHFQGLRARFICMDSLLRHPFCKSCRRFREEYFNLFFRLIHLIGENDSYLTRLKLYASLLTCTYLPHDTPMGELKNAGKLLKALSYIIPYTWGLMILAIIRKTRCH